ncbi:DUF1292 domain-containing protein [Clostridium ganghwense]|uniref:DUF1292 domain-containing protein n=1 Tax=Clostridium ganghwense TaxID=312089 RepID=A0ABT4CQM1_9CLOT|nr:DUF1292 domain-containing protein [Clostridium ganghwense]MCY6371355.1 DUF1292 domain-containing protein [Clostridium ganghwense]
METKQTITVKNELGKKVELVVVDAIKIANDKYVIVSQQGSDEANAYREVNRNGEVEYTSIGAGAEFKRVLEAYNTRHNQ